MQDGWELGGLPEVDASLLLEVAVPREVPAPASVLEEVDWDLVATSTLGIMDPIGQLREFLASLLTGFVDTIKKAFEAIASPIKSVVDTIWSVVSAIPGTLSAILDALKGVVVKPVLDALDWVASVLPRLAELARSALEYFARTITELPNYVRSFVDTVAGFFTDLADRVRVGFAWLLEQIGKLPDTVGGLVNSVVAAFRELAERVRAGFAWFIDQVARLPDVVRGLVDAVTGLFSDLADRIRSGFAWFIEQVTKIPDYVRGFIESVGRFFSELADRVRSGFAWFLEQVSKIPGLVAEWIGRVVAFFSDLADRIRAGLAWFVEQVARLPEVIRGFVEGVARFFSELAERVRAGFAWFIEQLAKIPGLVAEWVSRVAGFFSDLAERVRAGFAWFIEQVARLPEVVRGFVESVTRFFADLAERVRAGFSWFIEQVARLPELVRDLVTRVVGLFSELAERVGAGFAQLVEHLRKAPDVLRDVIARIIGDVVTGIGGVVEWVRRGFEGLGTTITRWFEDAGRWFSEATKVLQGIGAAFMGFVNALLQLPERFKEMFGGVVKFFEGVWEGFQEFAKDPLSWLRKYFVEPLVTTLIDLGSKILEGLRFVGEKMWGALQWLWGVLQSGFSWFVQGVTWLGGVVAGALRSFWDWAVSATGKFIAAVVDTFSAAARWFYDNVIKPAVLFPEWAIGELAKGVAKVVESVKGALGIASPEFLELGFVERQARDAAIALQSMIAGWFLLTAMGYGVGYLAKNVGIAIGNLVEQFRVHAEPEGIGYELVMRIGYALGATFGTLGDILMQLGDILGRNFVMGYALWMTRPLSRLAALAYRNWLPVEIPTVGEVTEFMKRTLGHEKRKEFLEAAYWFLSVYGYSDYFVKRMIGAVPTPPYEVPGEVPHIVVVDRFDIPRKIPLALSYEIPTHSELVAMTIRDIVIRPEEIQKFLAIRGLTPDVAALYYMYRFRYPSPERLAEFYWRGVAGVLWYDLTLEEPEIRRFLKVRWEAVPPSKLNFEVGVLNDMMARYMKWHDYAPVAWSEGYPTDKSVVMELTASLPDKVDYRWMARWGILEHLSRLGVGMKTGVAKILEALARATGRETVSTKVTPEISLDVSLLARFLEAKGVHPYFAAISAVAEMHVALTDEMTLLRTGFLELFRTGLATLDTTEHLMSGLFVVEFTTGYIDHRTGSPVTVKYRKPVYWLPAERRLLQLRAVLDRGYDLWRTALREVASGVARLALKPEEGRDILRGYAPEVAKLVSSQVKRLTGVDWSPALDEEYMELWLRYGELLRTVEARTWIRHYITRLMAWILYRTSYGWVRPEDMDDLVDQIAGKGWLVGEEAEFFKLITRKVVGIVRRETIPTALTLATMAEYMVIDEETIDRVFEDQRVVEEYRDLYRLYIKVKPFKSDFKALLNRARRALILGAIAREEWESLKREAVEEYGFRDVEIAIQERLAELEERIASSREYSPSPSTLATLSEYVSIPREMVEAVLKARRIPEEWARLWVQYIAVKPLKSDYRAVLSTALRTLRRGAITREYWDTLVKGALEYGFTEQEVSLLQLRAELELMMEEVEVWRPSIGTLLAMLEYVPDAVKLLKYYRVDPVFRPYVERYALVRPLADEVRTLINAFYRAKRYVAVPRELEERVLSIAKQLGVTDAELALRDLALEFQVLVDEHRAWVPTPATLAVLAEYLVLARELVERALRARRVPEEWVSVWLQYIAVRPLKADYRAVLTTALRALRYRAIAEDTWRKLLEEATKYGFTKPEVELLQLRADLELTIEEAKEYVPTPSALATMSEYLPEVRNFIKEVLEARRVKGVWAELWTKYIYLRPVYDETRRWASAMFTLAEYLIVDVKQLEPVFKILETYGWEKLEVEIATKTILAEQVRVAFNYVLGSPRSIATMARYTDKAADWAYTRAVRLIDALPVDNATKELIKQMWREYIMSYQAYPEIRSYMTELINAYAYGVLDDRGLEDELGYLRKLGVPELRLALVKRTAQLRRIRYAVRYG